MDPPGAAGFVKHQRLSLLFTLFVWHFMEMKFRYSSAKLLLQGKWNYTMKRRLISYEIGLILTFKTKQVSHHNWHLQCLMIFSRICVKPLMMLHKLHDLLSMCGAQGLLINGGIFPCKLVTLPQKVQTLIVGNVWGVRWYRNLISCVLLSQRFLKTFILPLKTYYELIRAPHIVTVQKEQDSKAPKTQGDG